MKRFFVTSTLAATLSFSAVSQAQSDVEQARTFFNVGAEAYEKGEYKAAIQAFDAAFKLAKRPTLVFSIAQAYRRQYYLDKNRGNLDASIRNYNLYLAMVTEGGRRGDVAEALAELEPIQRKLQEESPTDTAAPVETPTEKTRLMVSSKTEGAKVSLDGKTGSEPPLISEVKPGLHKVVVSAKGFFDEVREVRAAEGGVVALDIALRPKPAVVTLKVAAGAEVSVDGRLVGETPLTAPLRLPPGRHLITVAKNGHEAYSEEVVLGRGEARELDTELHTTTQRFASHILIGVGGVGILAGGAFGGIAFKKDRDAKDINSRRRQENIELGEVDRFESLKSERDTWRVAASVTLGAGAAIGLTGFLMRVFDEPRIKAPPPRELQQPEGPERVPEPSMEIAVAPSVGPGWAGASVLGRF